jgi:hypothetical protein
MFSVSDLHYPAGFRGKYANTSIAKWLPKVSNSIHEEHTEARGYANMNHAGRGAGSAKAKARSASAAKYSISPQIFHRIDGATNRYSIDFIGGQGWN